MNCSESKYVMPLYLSSELDTKLMADFELHIERCGACSNELESALHCDELLREAFREQPAATAALRARVRSQISGMRRGRRMRLWRPRYSLPVAALLFLAVSAGISWFILRGGSSQTVYAAALEDHYEEVVQHAPIEGWRETPDEINAFVRKRLGATDFLDRLAPAGYGLARARLCDLSNKLYVHLVYRNETREISVFIRPNQTDLPGPAVEVVNGCAIHAAAINRFEIAGFQSHRYTVLVVSDLPRAESLAIARNAAARLST